MNRISRTMGTAALLLAASALQAEDFGKLMSVVHQTWPEKWHIGVVCDYRESQAQVEALARAAGGGTMITVADIRRTEQAAAAARLLADRQMHYLVLLPEDRATRDGSFGATLAVRTLAQRGLPSVGTTAKALEQGAVFSVGDGTNGEVLVTNRLKGTVDVILPAGITFSHKASLSLAGGMATISVISAQ